MLSKDKNSNVYYNIIQQNDSKRTIQAVFSETRVQPILEKPSDYELAVVRFSVPTYDIPIMFFRDGTLASNNESYVVTLEYEDETISKTLVPVPNEIPNPLYGRPAVWAYQEMVDAINLALADAFADLKALKPLAPQTEPPFLTFDGVTNLFTLYAEQLYDSTALTPMRIYFNKTLFKILPSFEIIFDDSLGDPNKRHQLLVKNNKINGTTYNGKPYYTMAQESSTLSLWYDFVSIQFETDTIPVNPEFAPTANNTISRVLTDFEPLTAEPSREVIQFFPQGPLRYYDLTSNFPMKSIDLRIRWKDKSNVSYPLYIASGDQFTCKLQFRLKAMKQLDAILDESKDNS
jgi:hypothetical protein